MIGEERSFFKTICYTVSMYHRLSLFGISLLIFLSTSIFPRVIFASCIEQPVTEQKEQSDIIVLGRAQKIDRKGLDAIITVEKYFKGHGGPLTILVTGQDAQGAFTSVDFIFEEGITYLLFMDTTGGDIFKTNVCSGSREVTEGLTQQELQTLGNGETVISSFSATQITDETNKRSWIVLTVLGVGLVLSAPIILSLTHKKR